VLHDGTLVFRETFDNGLILYREGDRRRKRFNPGTIRFLREYRDSTTGEYRVSFTGLYYSEFYGGEFDDSFVTVQSDAYSMPTAEFLDIGGVLIGKRFVRMSGLGEAEIQVHSSRIIRRRFPKNSIIAGSSVAAICSSI
jgi:hypothetical protein